MNSRLTWEELPSRLNDFVSSVCVCVGECYFKACVLSSRFLCPRYISLFTAFHSLVFLSFSPLKLRKFDGLLFSHFFSRSESSAKQTFFFFLFSEEMVRHCAQHVDLKGVGIAWNASIPRSFGLYAGEFNLRM